jgi:hypothetical protein
VYHNNGRASALLLRLDESEVGDAAQAVDRRYDGCRIHRAASEADVVPGANRAVAQLGDAPDDDNEDDDADDGTGSTRSPQSSAVAEACSPKCPVGSAADTGEQRPAEAEADGGSGGSPIVSVTAGCGARQREPRTTISGPQLNALLAAFSDTPKPSRQAREQLATRTGLSMRVIQVILSTGRLTTAGGSEFTIARRASEQLTFDEVGKPFNSAPGISLGISFTRRT